MLLFLLVVLRIVGLVRQAVTPQQQSFSAGLACWDGQEISEGLVARADRARYQAKTPAGTGLSPQPVRHRRWGNRPQPPCRATRPDPPTLAACHPIPRREALEHRLIIQRSFWIRRTGPFHNGPAGRDLVTTAADHLVPWAAVHLSAG
jgi:hypothetical protein